MKKKDPGDSLEATTSSGHDERAFSFSEPAWALIKQYLPDWDLYLKRDHWTCHEAAFLLLNLNPIWGHIFHKQQVEPDEKEPAEEIALKGNMLRAAIHDSYEGGNLEVAFLTETKTLGYDLLRIRPQVFVRWAKSRGYEIPDEMGFFDATVEAPDTHDFEEIVDTQNRRHSARLAAAIQLWLKLNEYPPQKQTPNQAIRDRLDQPEFADCGFSESDKKLIAYLVNWKKGGAVATKPENAGKGTFDEIFNSRNLRHKPELVVAINLWLDMSKTLPEEADPMKHAREKLKEVDLGDPQKKRIVQAVDWNWRERKPQIT